MFHAGFQVAAAAGITGLAAKAIIEYLLQLLIDAGFFAGKQISAQPVETRRGVAAALQTNLIQHFLEER